MFLKAEDNEIEYYLRAILMFSNKILKGNAVKLTNLSKKGGMSENKNYGNVKKLQFFQVNHFYLFLTILLH